MRKLTSLLLAVVALGVAGCGGDDGSERASEQVPFDRVFIDTMVPHVDQAFAGMMIGHHTGAIRMATLAKERAGHEEVKTLAGDIITAQQREIALLERHAMGGHG